MTLPAPNLDDRRFQDLVDEAKRLVQQRCPEWTDHNVSDPGVTIIEAFAWMTDQLLRRLNQVPDRNHVKFLELLGVRLFPPVAARADVTFWLSASQPEAVNVPAGTKVATVRTESEPAIVFTTVEDLAIVPCSRSHVASSIEDDVLRDHTEDVTYGEGVTCFDEPPKPGDALLIGLSNAVPSCAVTLRFECEEARGGGVDPLDPPLAWEARDRAAWMACDVVRDDTGGLNRSGDVVLLVPETHEASILDGKTAGWLRCRVVEARPGQPRYGASPRVVRASAMTSGGTATAVNAEVVVDEVVGVSEGVPGQRFPLRNSPVIASDDPVRIEVPTADGVEEWLEVSTFADSGSADRHFVIEHTSGEIVFGPAVRQPSGDPAQYGAIPLIGSEIKVAAYRTGGGAGGNVAAGAIKMLKSSIPYIVRAENRRRATGGVDGEDLANAKVRGPMHLRGTRAVAARDFEHQATLAAPNEVVRVRCLPAGDGADAGGVRVLVVPAVRDDAMGRLVFGDLAELPRSLVEKIGSHLDRRRVVGTRVTVEPPLYMGISIEAQIRVAPRTDPKRLEQSALEALYRYFHPLRGGPDGTGWPFGRPVHGGEVFWVLQRLPGVAFVEDARLYAANPLTQQRGREVERLELAPNALVFSTGHAIDVLEEGAAT
ncbi:MAG: putative baseplate assembly protein [Actinomycetota bacterium]